MTTSIQPDRELDQPEPGAQSLMIWLGGAMLAVTVIIIVGCTQFSPATGVGIAFGTLVVAALGVLVYIMRFIGPED